MWVKGFMIADGNILDYGVFNESNRFSNNGQRVVYCIKGIWENEEFVLGLEDISLLLHSSSGRQEQWSGHARPHRLSQG